MENSPKSLLEQTKTARQARRAWYLYDFGNSAYAAIILLAVFSAYFKNVVVGGAEGTRMWGIAVGIAAILVALISPILGAIADSSRSKKLFLFVFTGISVIFTALLFFVGKGDTIMAMVFFIMAETGYRGAQVFYDALLVDVSTPETIGYISGKGWAIGMVGGVVTLLIAVVPLQIIGNEFIPYTFLITAFVYAISSLPMYFRVHETSPVIPIPEGETLLSVSFKHLYQTFKDIRNYKVFLRYMIAFLIYNDGIMMLMDFAAIIGATLFGLEQVQLIIFVIIIHITGALGALIFGKLSDEKSSKRSILLSLIILVISLIVLFFIKSTIGFFIIGAFAGFSLSGAQAVSRTMVSQLAPASKTTEFYGFLSVAGRTSTFIGPLVFGTLSYRMHNFYLSQGLTELAAEKAGQYWGVGSIIAFLLIGFLILLSVKEVTASKPMVYNEEQKLD
ncbi:MAG: MFS transporter [Anaerolineaceae bacterium]|jgi:UMF1 family MFS transporter|nr:MFS transporter [Anaerolineaceae bacterium]MDI9530663.1 MFS transporter [Chloroflexota bacterium]